MSINQGKYCLQKPLRSRLFEAALTLRVGYELKAHLHANAVNVSKNAKRGVGVVKAKV